MMGAKLLIIQERKPIPALCYVTTLLDEVFEIQQEENSYFRSVHSMLDNSWDICVVSA